MQPNFDQQNYSKKLSLRNVMAIGLSLALTLSFENKLYLSPIVVLVLLLFFLLWLNALILYNKVKYNKLFLYYLLILFYTQVSFWAGGLSISSLLTFEFWRYDGNIYYTMVPLLFIPILIGHSIDVDKLLKVFVIAATVAGIIAYIIGGYKGRLFSAHNAMGGFYMIVSICAFVLAKKDKVFIFLFAGSIALLMLSHSRGSQLGFFTGIIALFLWKFSKKAFILAFFCSFLLWIGLLGFGFSVWKDMGKPVCLTLSETNDFDYPQFSHIGRFYTIAHRIFFYYPLAINDFFTSPVIGIGFTRFDDIPRKFVGRKNLLSMNNSSYINHSDLHAHSSPLHIAAELGIIGILLFSSLFISVLKWCSDLSSDNKYLLWTLTVSSIAASITEHRITTPAQMFPYWCIAVLLITSRPIKKECLL
ncbi:MAG: O-antigen ligase family protein [Desulfobacterales bacterium]